MTRCYDIVGCELDDMISCAVFLLEPGEEHVGGGEYLRGMANLIAECYPLPDCDTSCRSEEISKMIVRKSRARRSSWYTGKVGSHSATRHNSLEEAQAWIERMQIADPVGVNRGDYYIDGPAVDVS